MNKQLKKSLALTAMVLCGGLAVGMFRTTAPQQGGIADLANGSVLELPEKAARLVAQADNKEAKAGEVIHAITAFAQPDMMLPIVSAISKAAPEAAAAAAAAAVSAQPSDVLAIAKSAMAAAPESVAAIVAAVCRQTPQAHSYIAFIAARQVPGAGEKILSAITSSIPEMAPHIAKAKMDAGDLSVSSILKRADEMAYAQAVEEAKTAKLSSIKNRSTAREIPSEQPTTAIAAATSANQKARTQLSFMNQPAYGEVIMPRFGAPFVPAGLNIKEISIKDLTVVDYARP